MALPQLIEIVPQPDLPSGVEITIPGSKSLTNRALILAALADGERVLTGALWSEDTQVMVECLQALGFALKVEQDPNEPANRIITVQGRSGAIPSGGTEQKPLELFVGNAGTAARFLAAFICLGRGVYRLHGVPRMHERPQAALFKALRELGYRVEPEAGNDRLPVRIFGTGPREAECTVSIAESSQFASALLLCEKPGRWRVGVVGENAEESPYVAMTVELRKSFEKSARLFQIEPDASSGSYFWAAGWLLAGAEARKRFSLDASPVRVRHWPSSGWQIDAEFPKFLPLPDRVSRYSDLGDSIMTGIALAPLAAHPVTFTDLGRLRVQECERVVALRTELTKCGATIIEKGDTLEIFPSELHGAEIETYNDHRMAMCFATLGLKVPGITLKNPACVKKTFPNFFQKLAAPFPDGLGATVLDPSTRQVLAGKALFAE